MATKLTTEQKANLDALCLGMTSEQRSDVMEGAELSYEYGVKVANSFIKMNDAVSALQASAESKYGDISGYSEVTKALQTCAETIAKLAPTISREATEGKAISYVNKTLRPLVQCLSDLGKPELAKATRAMYLNRLTKGKDNALFVAKVEKWYDEATTQAAK